MRTRFLALVTILAPVIAKRTLQFSLPFSPSFSSSLLPAIDSAQGTEVTFYIRWKSSARMCECETRMSNGGKMRVAIFENHMEMRIPRACRCRRKCVHSWMCTTNERNVDVQLNTHAHIHMLIQILVTDKERICGWFKVGWGQAGVTRRKKLKIEPLLFIEK